MTKAGSPLSDNIKPPLWVNAEITYKCPLHCVFCYNPLNYASTFEKELSTEQWLKALREARELGAAVALNYKEPGLKERILDAAGGPVDRIVEVAFGSNTDLLPDILKPNGTVATYASDAVPEPSFPFNKWMGGNVNIRMFTIYQLDRLTQDEVLQTVSPLMSPDTLVHRIGERFQFEDMVKAHEAVEAGEVHGVAQVVVGKALEHQ